MNRKIVVPVVLVLGAIGASVAITQGRDLGPTGAATGTSGGCAGPSELQALEEGPVEELEYGEVVEVTPSQAPLPDAFAQQAVPGRFVIKLNRTMLPNRTANLGEVVSGLELANELDQLADNTAPFNDDVWTFESDAPWDEVMDRLTAFDEVEYVEPVFTLTASQDSGDPLKAFQWNVGVFGSAPATDVVVAVIDTGVDYGGADGIGAMVAGYDFVDDDTDPTDLNGHGTHVAGTIAAATGNGVGVAAIAPGAKIMAVRVLDADGSGTSTDVAAGIEWATDNGADVINLSLGGNSYSALIADAVEYAFDNGVVVVAAAGNDGFTNAISYPAANPGAIAVGAVGLDYVVTSYSNKGAELDVVAPGGDLSEDIDGDGYNDGILQETVSSDGSFGYSFFQGTSMATPHVAALAAVLIADGLTDPQDVTDAILETASDQGDDGFDTSYGWGFADMEAARAWQPPANEATTNFTLDDINYTIRPNHRRAEITWTTTVKSDTCVSWGGGRVETCKVKEPLYTERHRRIVGVNPCKDRPYVLKSVSEDGVEVTETLIIPENPEGCSQ